MNLYATTDFWNCYDQLPGSVQEKADKALEQLKSNPKHPSLHLKKVDRFWSVRAGLKYWALAVKKDGDLIWFWIGTHADYDNLIS